MKQLLTIFKPLFNPTAQTLDFTALSGFNINKLYAVINVSQNTPIYIPGATGYGASSVNNSIITLQYNTTAHNSNDNLSIFYETTGYEHNLALENGGNLQQINENLTNILTEIKLTNYLLAEGFSRTLNINTYTDELQRLREDINTINNNIPTG